MPLRCTLCEVNAGLDELLYPHQHHHGEIPLLPCLACFYDNHDGCDPRDPYWCVCSHPDCLKEAP